uniref:Polyprotein n=1 Tax=Begonia plebeja nepovirus TaxID=3115757 RepID=A0AAT9J7U4_9SECO
MKAKLMIHQVAFFCSDFLFSIMAYHCPVSSCPGFNYQVSRAMMREDGDRCPLACCGALLVKRVVAAPLHKAVPVTATVTRNAPAKRVAAAAPPPVVYQGCENLGPDTYVNRVGVTAAAHAAKLAAAKAYALFLKEEEAMEAAVLRYRAHTEAEEKRAAALKRKAAAEAAYKRRCAKRATAAAAAAIQQRVAANRAILARKIKEARRAKAARAAKIAAAAARAEARAQAGPTKKALLRRQLRRAAALKRTPVRRPKRTKTAAVPVRTEKVPTGVPYVCPLGTCVKEAAATPAKVEGPRTCAVPWAHLPISLTALRGRAVVDGTLGANSLSQQGDYTCNSTLGFPTRCVATPIWAASLKRARRVIASTIAFVQQCFRSAIGKVQEVALKKRTNEPLVQQVVAHEDEDKYASWQGCQLPEMGVRNIYAFHDDSWDASPEEDDKYTITYSRRCGPCVHSVVSDVKGAGERNNTPRFEEIDKQTNEPSMQWMVTLEEEEKCTSWQGCQLPEMGVRNIYAFHDDSWDATPEEVENNTDGSSSDPDFTWVIDKYCVNRGAFFSSPPVKRRKMAPIFRNLRNLSHAWYLEYYRRQQSVQVEVRCVRATCLNPLHLRWVFFKRERMGILPVVLYRGKGKTKVSLTELDYVRDPEFNPYFPRDSIHTNFIYCAELLEGCEWNETIVQGKIENCTPENRTVAFGSPVPYGAIPIISRGDFRARGKGVLASLLNYTPFGDLTCNSALGDPSGELQERMDDRGEQDGVQSIQALTAKLASRKSKVSGAGENRVADKRQLSEKMVFHQPGVIARMRSSGVKTITAANLNSDLQSVRMQKQGMPSFTPLPRMSEEHMRKLLEKGIGSTSSVALDIGIQSHIPQGMPVVAFLNVMDTRLEKPEYSSLCGSYIDLGRDRAKTLCLPLANFPLTKAIEDTEDVLHGLVLATYFQDCTGFGIGKPAFQYGTLEFQEFKESAYSDYSRVRDNWDEIAKRQNTPGDRVIAGFSVLGAVSQEYNEALPEFGPIELRCPPVNKPVVATYRDAQKLNRSRSTRSFQMPSIGLPNATGRAQIPIQTGVRSPPRVKTAEEITPPRYSTCNSGIEADMMVAYYAENWCSRDAKGDTLLARVNLRSALLDAGHRFSLEWLAKGLIAPNFSVRLTVANNPFVGVSLGVCMDYADRCATKKLGTNKMFAKLANHLPNFVCPLSAGPEFICNFDFEREAGYGVFPTATHFVDPVLLVYVISDNTLPCASDWRYSLEILVKQAEPSALVVGPPLLSFPHSFDGNLPIKTWRGPFSMSLGKSKPVACGLNFGRFETYKTDSTTIGFYAALSRFIQGHGGILHGRIVRTGTCMVSSALHLVIAPNGTVTTMAQAMLLPGLRMVTGEGSFSLKLQTPFGRASMLEPDLTLTIFCVGGPIAAEKVSAPYEFMVYFDSMHDEGAIPRTIGTVMEFNWATMTNFTEAEFRFQIPARLSDIVLKSCTVAMRQHPLAMLIGSSIFMKGTMDVCVQWLVNTAMTNTSGGVQLLTCQGDLSMKNPYETIMQSQVSALYSSVELKTTLDVGNFSGYTASAATPGYRECFVDFWTNSAKSIHMLNVNVTLHPGFSLWGRSILPLTGNRTEQASPQGGEACLPKYCAGNHSKEAL